ncbi:hypothetical protein B0J14DRAFT_603230 [Halenospora varia]|nr:hypothetical protein B0J14DRAFT_603230 [Halenospora varia]
MSSYPCVLMSLRLHAHVLVSSCPRVRSANPLTDRVRSSCPHPSVLTVLANFDSFVIAASYHSKRPSLTPSPSPNLLPTPKNPIYISTSSPSVRR